MHAIALNIKGVIYLIIFELSKSYFRIDYMVFGIDYMTNQCLRLQLVYQ